MGKEDFLEEALDHSRDYVAYHVARKLAKLYPDKAIVQGNNWEFDLEDYVRAEKCSLVNETSFLPEIRTEWEGKGEDLYERIVHAWLNVLWRGHLIDVLLMSFTETCYRVRHQWIIADDKKIAEEFLRDVCEWNGEVHGEVLVFEDGSWVKSKELFDSIKSSTFDKLVLKGSLKEEIREDFDRFFASRELYQRHGIPWKRGVLFTGPPGNGKTHTVKALINHVQKPCLYVKCFDMPSDETVQEGIRQVFNQARQSSPCVLVLEDLDSMINDKTRSFFLNELDGFAENSGIMVLATTNYPEKLDPAIRDRPSRFDRKYNFDLPAEDERRAYVEVWNESLEAELRLSDQIKPVLVSETEGFSFAYLKELFLSSMMRWMTLSGSRSMNEVIMEQVALLHEQMVSVSSAAAAKVVNAKGVRKSFWR